MLETLVLGGLSWLIAAPIAKKLGDDRAPTPAPASPARSPHEGASQFSMQSRADRSRIPGFRQMFTMPDGSIFSPMVNPPHSILEFHTAGKWFYGMVDTGASSVVLSHKDARDMGVRISGLKYDVGVSTAGGVRWAGKTTIPDMTIGAFSVKNVDALVCQRDDVKQTLVGQSFLRRIPRGIRMIEEGIQLYP